MHRVRAYTFDFCSFLSVAYTALNKLFSVFYTPCLGKKRPQYSKHNFDKFSHSFVIFGSNHLDS